MPLSNPQPSVDQSNVAISGGTISGVTVTSATLRIINGLDTQVSATKPTTRSGGGALVAGDQWLNTTDRLWFYWDGTYWLSEILFSAKLSAGSLAGNATQGALTTTSGYNVYAVSLSVSGGFVSPQDGSNFWTFRALRNNAATWASTAVGLPAVSSSLNVSSGTTGATITQSLNTHVDISSTATAGFQFSYIRTGAPGNVTGACMDISYRLAAI